MERIIKKPVCREKYGFYSWEPGLTVKLSNDGSLVEILHFYDEGEEDFDAVGGMPVVGVRPGDELQRLIEVLKEIQETEESEQ